MCLSPLHVTINSPAGHCQTKANRPAKTHEPAVSRGELTPFCECGSAVLFEDIAAVEVAVVVEVVVDRCVHGGEFLQGPYGPEPLHRSFSSSERLVGIFCAIVEPPTTLLIGGIADYFHRRSVRAKPVGYN